LFTERPFFLSTEDLNNESITEMKEAKFSQKLNTKLGDKQVTLNQLEQNECLAVEEGMPAAVEEVSKHEQYFDEDVEPLAPIPEADKSTPC
jgi:hypothetical protein